MLVADLLGINTFLGFRFDVPPGAPGGDRGEPGVVVRHVRPQPEEGVEPAVVGEELGPAVAQVPLAHQMRAVPGLAQQLGQRPGVRELDNIFTRYCDAET